MSQPRIAIVDYQAGNLHSVRKALERFGVSPVVTADPLQVQEADALVVPGQGACDSAMRQMRERGLEQPIVDFIASGKPYLGICLGLQLLLEASDEGDEPCLGVLKGRVRKLPPGQKVPHMGWNDVKFNFDNPIFRGVPQGSYFYFVHSYYADPVDSTIVGGTTTYGREFCSAAMWGNAVAVQFHPEKSGSVGLKVYENFVARVRELAQDGE